MMSGGTSMDMGPYPQPGVGPPVTGMNMPQHGVNFNFHVFWKSIACKINLAGSLYIKLCGWKNTF